MATTTNYSWTTPDDTALVKDGAAAIRSLGTAIDTTVFTNAGAAIAKTIVDAKGDIIAATAADTVSRLAVGANDTVLTADSSTATGLKWGTISAGGLTLLSTTTLSGSSTTISSISTSYTNLLILVRDVYQTVNNENMFLRLNSDSGANYANISTNISAVTLQENEIRWTNGSSSTSALRKSQMYFNLYNYTSTGTKHYDYISTTRDNEDRNKIIIGGGVYTGSSAVTSILFTNQSGSFSGGTVLIYGVK